MLHQKLHQKLKLVKNNIGLFSRLFVANQTRDGDLDTFLAHENQAASPSPSKTGLLELLKKILEILSCLLNDDPPSEAPEIDAKVIDAASIINMFKPIYGKTFCGYAINRLVPYFQSPQTVKRVDLVWDTYFAESLKNCMREKRGDGFRRKVTGNCLLLTN